MTHPTKELMAQMLALRGVAAYIPPTRHYVSYAVAESPKNSKRRRQRMRGRAKGPKWMTRRERKQHGDYVRLIARYASAAGYGVPTPEQADAAMAEAMQHDDEPPCSEERIQEIVRAVTRKEQHNG